MPQMETQPRIRMQGDNPWSVLPAELSLAQQVSYLGMERNTEPQCS